MLRRVLVPLVLLMASVAPVPGRAAATHVVDVVNNAFSPSAVVAATGDTIRWNFRGNGHRVQAYSGSDFDSGLLNKNPGETFDHTFGGGTIMYRCPNHSTLSGPANDCTGMCGKLTDVAPSDLPRAPTVSSPAHNSTTDSRTVTFFGSLIGNATRIRMFEGVTELGPGVRISGGNWSASWIFENGTHDIHFIAEHPEGYHSPAGPAREVPNPNGPGTIIERFIRVNVAASDSQAPEIVLDQPRDPYSRNPLIITGRVTDDVAVGTIEVIVRDRLGLSVDRRPAVTRQPGVNNVAFSASASVDPGPYTIIVRAKDLTNNPPTEIQRDVIVLV